MMADVLCSGSRTKPVVRRTPIVSSGCRFDHGTWPRTTKTSTYEILLPVCRPEPRASITWASRRTYTGCSACSLSSTPDPFTGTDEHELMACFKYRSSLPLGEVRRSQVQGSQCKVRRQ